MSSFEFDARTLDDTKRLGRALGRAAEAGLVVALNGTLGAGKTCFVRAVAEGLEVPDPRVVTSPTFILIQEYAARLPIYHFDTYRLSNPASFAELGAEEYFTADGICLVEWAERVAELLPEDYVRIDFDVSGPSSRHLHCHAVGQRWERLMMRWQEELLKWTVNPSPEEI